MSRTISRVRRSRRYRNECHPIAPGDLYIEHTGFPGGDNEYANSAGHPVRMAECRACAERYGRKPLIDAYLAARSVILRAVA